MGEIRDMGGLLQRAGFALPVADGFSISARYDDAFHLMKDLRAMGENNAMNQRQKCFSRRALFHRANEIYQMRFTADMHIQATFELIFMTGWAPDPSQPKPLSPGSAEHRLTDFLGSGIGSSRE